MQPLEEGLGYLVGRVAAELREQLDRELLPLGISGPQWVMLARIDRKASSTPAELAAVLQISRPAVTGLLDRMSRAGLVTRVPSATDGRSFTLRATPKGKRLLCRVPPVVEQLNRELTRCLSDAELDTLRDLLTRLLSSLKGRAT